MTKQIYVQNQKYGLSKQCSGSIGNQQAITTFTARITIIEILQISDLKFWWNTKPCFCSRTVRSPKYKASESFNPFQMRARFIAGNQERLEFSCTIVIMQKIFEIGVENKEIIFIWHVDFFSDDIFYYTAINTDIPMYQIITFHVLYPWSIENHYSIIS